MSKYSSRDQERLEGNPEAKIYVGDLSSHVTKQDLDDTFSYYGPIRNLWIARNPPGFAFIEFEDARDAVDAVKDTEGRRQYCKRKVCGKPVRIELSNRSYSGKRRSTSNNRCYNCDGKGHLSRDCYKKRSQSRRSYPRDRSRSRRRSPSYRRESRKHDRSSDSSSSEDRKKSNRRRSSSSSSSKRRSSSSSPRYRKKKHSDSHSSRESR